MPALPTNGCASTADSKAMNGTHASALVQVAVCGASAGPYA
jgi:hypothetical protein